MAAVSRLQSLTNKASFQNLVQRHLLRPAAAAAAAEPVVHFDLQNLNSILTGHFTGNNKLSSSNANEFLLNRNFPIGGVSALPTFDLSKMELRGSRSTSSKKNLPDLEEDLEDDDDDEDFEFENDDDDDDGGMKGFELDDESGSCNDSDDDEDDYGRRGGGGGGGRGGSRGGGAYRV